MTFRIEGFIGEDPATAEALASYLATARGRAEVVINSPGGNAFEGSACMAELEAHGRTRVIIRGIAASAASLIAMGGAEIVMHRDAMLMIHDPSGITIGPAAAHRKNADTLDQVADTYAAAYARATGHSLARIRDWMAQETWFTADEALALNFIDRIEGGEGAPVALSPFDFTMFTNAPPRLIALAQENGWAAA
jgi:ATP-dependent protease ClpP protease subunit